MDRFCYSTGEIEIATTQCGLCVYRISDNKEACQKFEKKPDEIQKDKRKCPYIRNAKLLDL